MKVSLNLLQIVDVYFKPQIEFNTKTIKSDKSEKCNNVDWYCQTDNEVDLYLNEKNSALDEVTTFVFHEKIALGYLKIELIFNDHIKYTR